jgi:hypothetical protein
MRNERRKNLFEHMQCENNEQFRQPSTPDHEMLLVTKSHNYTRMSIVSCKIFSLTQFSHVLFCYFMNINYDEGSCRLKWDNGRKKKSLIFLFTVSQTKRSFTSAKKCFQTNFQLIQILVLTWNYFCETYLLWRKSYGPAFVCKYLCNEKTFSRKQIWI